MRVVADYFKILSLTETNEGVKLMRKTIGIVNVTNGCVAYPVSYFLKEYFSFAIQNGFPVPRIVIDNITEIENKSTAYSSNEQCDNVVDVLGSALEGLITSKADKAIILCNICHLYVEGIFSAFPTIQTYFINVVEEIVSTAKSAGVSNILVLCSENARKSQMFDRYFANMNISVFYADKEQNIIHSLMDAAEQNNIDDDVISKLYKLCMEYKNHAICFACTELSMIYGYNKEMFKDFKIYDGVDVAIKRLNESICK